MLYFQMISFHIIYQEKQTNTEALQGVPPLHAPPPTQRKTKNKKETRTFLENVNVSLILRERQLSFNTFAVFGYF